MRIRAENDPRYHYKFLFMGGLVLFGALWFLKDGIWGYPAHEKRGFEDFKYDFKNLFSDANRQAMSFDEFKNTANDEELKQWEEYAVQREIPTGVKITEQFAYAILLTLLGLAFLWGPLRSRGRWIEASDEGVASSWGESFRFDEVEAVNKRAWRKKGIAKVTYVSSGRRRTFVIDDFKYQRWATDAILYTLEQRIDQGRIINGPPESEPEPDGKVAEVLAASSGSGPPA